jgi:hypothetical protein
MATIASTNGSAKAGEADRAAKWSKQKAEPRHRSAIVAIAACGFLCGFPPRNREG